MAAYTAGRSGNPKGRPRGALSRRTIAALEIEARFTKNPEEVFASVRAAAMAGDPTAMRLFMERAYPLRRGRPVLIELPPVEGAKDVARASGALLEAAARGELTPAEAADLAKIFDAHVQALKVTELSDRLDALTAAAERRDRADDEN